MANEFIIKHGFLSKGNSEVTGSLKVTEGISGSFSGSFQGDGSALTGVDAFPFSGDAQITGSLKITGSFEAQSGTSLLNFETGASTGSADGKFSITSTGGSANISLHRTDGKQAALLAGTNSVGFHYDETGKFAIGPSNNPATASSFTTPTSFVMNSAGHVGINTSTPTARFDVVGKIKTSVGVESAAYVTAGSYITADSYIQTDSHITASGNISASGNLIGNTGSFDRTELGKSGALNGSIKFNTLHGPSYELIANNNSLTVSGTTGAPFNGFALDSQVENFSFLDGGTIRVLKGLTTGSGKGGGLHIQAQGSNQSNDKKGIFSTDTIGPYIGNSSYGSTGTHGTFRILNGLSSDNDADSGSFTSAEFGDYIKFNLPITASGNISSSGYVSASNFIGDGLTVTGDTQITGSLNVSGSLQLDYNGNGNMIIGSGSGEALTTGTDNIIFGNNAALGLDTGADNIIIGKSAASDTDIDDGANLILIGKSVGSNGTFSGEDNSVVIGNEAGVGASLQNSVLIGYQAANTATGVRNVAIGYQALKDNDGNDNVAIGYSTLDRHYASDDASENVVIGSYAADTGNAYANIDQNVVIGYQAMRNGASRTVGNIVIGYQAINGTGFGGDKNIVIGYQAGHSLASIGNIGNNRSHGHNIIIGPSASLAFSGSVDQLIIASGSSPFISGSLSTGDIIFYNTASAPNFSGSFQGDALSISKTTGTGAPGTGTTHSIAVTVSDPGSGNKYFLDGTETDSIVMNAGDAYKFDQSAANNNGHPFRLSTGTDGSGTAPYEVGVTYGAGSPGNANAYTQISVTTSTTAPLYYYCTQHSGMGGSGQLTVDSGSLNPMAGFANITGSLNVTGSTTVVGNVTATSFTGNGANLTNVPSPFTAAGISGSLGSNAALIRSLTATSITGAFAEASGGFSTRVTTLESSGGGSGFPFAGDGVISGSLLISSSNVGGVSTASMTLQGSGSTIFEIQGSQGQLFSVTDDLIHDVFNVSDISGDTLLKVSGSGLVEVPVGPISSSGLLFISASENAGQSTYKTLVQDPATGRIYHTGSYSTGTGGGGGDTYTLQAEAKSGTSVPLKLDAASGTDSTVNLTEGSNITLTRNSANQITIASAAGGGGGEWKDLGTTITSSKDVQITGSLIASGSVVNFASASSVILPAETVPLINPKVEYLTISEITASGTTVPLPNSLTFVSSSAFEYLEIFINGLRLRYDIDFAPMSTSTVKYLTTIPSGSEVTYKSLKRE